MKLFFIILSIVYIACIFVLAGSSMVKDFSPFNPYSLLHIPLYGVLTILLIFSLMPSTKRQKDVTNKKRYNSTNNINEPKVLNHPNDHNPYHSLIEVLMTERIYGSSRLRFFASTHKRLLIAGFIALGVAISDEIHQAYIPSREASITDVLLDIVGISLLMILIRLGLGVRS
jgi:VanZ family protein